MKLIVTLLTLFTLSCSISYGQSMGVGTDTPNANAVLHLVSPTNNQGLMIPSLTTSQRTNASFTSALSSTDNGLLVFDSNLLTFFYWDNSQGWVELGANVSFSAGTGISISNGSISNTGDLDDSNELQSLTLTGGTLEISGGNSIDMSVIEIAESYIDSLVENNGYLTFADLAGYDTDASDDFDGDFNSLTNIPADLSDGDQVDDADADPTNEMISSVTLETGNILRITEAGNNNDLDLSSLVVSGSGDMNSADYDVDGNDIVDNAETVNGLTVETAVPAGAVFTDSTLDESEVDAYVSNNGYLTAEVDGSTTNELISSGSLIGTTLRITDAGGDTDIDLSSLQDGTGTDDQDASEVAVTPAGGVTSTNVQAALVELQGEIAAGGGGDMLEAIYDTDGDDIVDDSQLVNGLTVETAVPVGAVFTDTQLTEGEVDTYVSDNGYLTAEVDGSITNEIQDLQLASDILTITNNGSATDIDLSIYLDNTDTQLTEAEVDAFVADNGYLTAEVDGSTTNELLTSGSMSGNTLRLFEGSNNVNVDLSQFDELPSQTGNSGRFLTTNGTSPSWAVVPTSPWTDGGSYVSYSGNVGINTTNPQNPFHLVESIAAVDGTDGAFMDIQNLNENQNALAGIRFKTNSTVASSAYKAGIFFQRGGLDGNTYGFGSLIFAMNNGNNTTNVTASDARFSIGTAGAAVTGNFNVSGFMDVDNNATFDGTIYANSVLDLQNELQVTNGAGAAGYILESGGSGSAPYWQPPVWDVTYGSTDYIYYGPGIASARLGLGTTSPSTALEVQTGLVLTPAIEIEATATSSEEASIRYLTTKDTYTAGVNGSGDYVIMDGNNLNTGTARMTINASAGTIGFSGTVAMSQALQHTGDTDTDMQFFTDRIQFRAGNRTMLDLQEGTSDYILMSSTNVVSTSTYFDINTPLYASLAVTTSASGSNYVRISTSNDQLLEYQPTVCPFLYIDNGKGFERETNIIEAQAGKYLEKLQSSIIPINPALEEVRVKIKLEEPETSYVDFLSVVIYKFDSVTNQELIDTLTIKSSSIDLEKLSAIDENYHVMRIGDSFDITFNRSHLMSGDFKAFVLSSGFYDIDFEAYQKPEWRELKFERFVEKTMDLDENGDLVQFRPLHIKNPKDFGYSNPESLLQVDGNLTVSNGGNFSVNNFKVNHNGRVFFDLTSLETSNVSEEKVNNLYNVPVVNENNSYKLGLEAIRELYPELLGKDNNLAATELIPLLIKALQEQKNTLEEKQNEISNLQDEVNQNKAQLDEFKTKLDALYTLLEPQLKTSN